MTRPFPQAFAAAVLLLLLMAPDYRAFGGGTVNLRPGFEMPAPPMQHTVTSADFVGIWNGQEKCTTMSTPAAILTFSADGPWEVLISGFYASQGYVRGHVRGNTIIISKQDVSDADFVINLSGSLTLSTDGKTILCKINIEHNGLSDDCVNVYHR